MNEDVRLVECLRLLEETGDLQRCLNLYPDLAQELRDSHSAARGLLEIVPPLLRAESQNSSRRLLLSSLSTTPGGISMWQRFFAKRATVLAAAAGMLVMGTVGVSAATGSPVGQPVSDVFGTLGIGDNHGQDVQEKVHDAIASSTPGAGRGEAVSEAACLAAHDRSTLPEGAQNAPGQQDKDPKDCGTATPEPSVSPAADATSTPEATSTPNHGQSVSKAVHDAIASTTPGPERGEAVSEAACTAAHDGSTLPGGAQNAPGQADREAKDCTHPSNAGDDGEDEGEDEGQSGNSNGNGNTPGSQGSEESQGHGNNGH